MISDQLNMRVKDQTPKAYSRDRLVFLENSKLFSTAPLVIQLQGNKVVIPAGKAHGVNVGSEIMLLLGTQSTLFSVDEVNKIWCSAIVPKRLSLLLKQYRHTITLSRWHLGEKKLQVYVNPAFGLDFRRRLQKLLEERIISPIEVLTSMNNRTDVLRLEKW